MPTTPVSPPQETPALYGLFTAARLLTLTGHDQGGINYDVVCDTTLKYWPGVCRPIPPGPPLQRNITVSFVGARSGADPNFTYTITAQATVDSGPERTLTIAVDGGAPQEISTGAAPIEIFSGTTSGAHQVVLTDTVTGTASPATAITQAVDGAVTPASMQLAVEDPTTAEKLAGAAALNVQATPFVIYGVEACLFGLSFDEQVARARQRLSLIEQPAVERTFWTGEQGNTPALATSSPTVLAPESAPVDITTGLSLLEQWLGQNTTMTGFIHVNRRAAAVASEKSLINRVGSRLETELGNVWVFGGGYPTSGPGGGSPPPDVVWMFASRQPTVRRTEVIVPAEPDNGATINVIRNYSFVVAERVFVVDFPCQTAAVAVDLSACRCGGGA